MNLKKQTPQKILPKVVVIGGGTGTYVVLSGLKKYPLELTAVVSMMDSGGSTGRLRDQLGVLPPGDVRQAMVALSSSPQIWRDLFLYRFGNGDLKGHNFGNIFISALEKITGSIEEALELASYILDVEGHIVPVTLKSADLCVEFTDKSVIRGETHIDKAENKRPGIINAFLKPKVKANPEAIRAIFEADFIIFGPGDLYTSIIPNLLVNGISAALKHSKAKKIYIVNLMTKLGQTTGYTAVDHLLEIERYCGYLKMEYVLMNDKRPSENVLKIYKGDLEHMIQDDLVYLEESRKELRVLRSDFLSKVVVNKNKADALKRSLIRHDPDKLAAALYGLMQKSFWR